MRKITNFLVLATCLFSFASAFAANDDFPGRKKYPKIPFIELADLTKQFNDVVVVDARSALEFETLHIKDSVNIPVAKKSFEDEVTKLRASVGKKPIVFYCNGRTCMKSFHATEKAMDVGIKNVFSFDAGIFEWTKANPSLAVLLGESPVNVAKLIPKKDLKKRFLEPDDFSDRATAAGSKTLILDVRDKYQRAGIGFYPGKERWASLDEKEKLRKYIRTAIDQKKTLMIYDEVGKQVRWLQYELEKEGAKDYYFMHKGAHGYFAAMDSWGAGAAKK